MDGSTDRDYTSAVYGSLLVTTLIAVQWRHDLSTTFLGLSLVISVAVFWLAHAWSAIINRRVHGPIDRAVVVAIARDEAPMLTAAVVPTIFLALASAGVLEVDIGIGLALLVSLVQLFLWGLAVGWVAHASWPLALGVAAVDGALGVAIVVLKVLVLH